MKSAHTLAPAPVTIDRDTAALARRLKPGGIAVIDHTDLPAATARALVRAQPAAVLNAARTISGRYPSLGARILLDADVVLIDDLGPDIMGLTEGNRVHLDDATVLRGEQVIAEGTRQTEQSVAADLAGAEAGVEVKLAGFSADAAGFVRQERSLLLSGEGVPPLRTVLRGRDVLVVADNERAAPQLRQLRTYIAQQRPVLIGVDAGTAILLAAGLKPDLIVGDMSTVPAPALASGAELVVVAAPDGRALGQELLERAGTEHVTFTVSAGALDAALLLAGQHGCQVIVVAGDTADLVELLESPRAGTSVLTRTALATRVVGAEAAARLYRNQLSGWYIFWLVAAGLCALAVAIAVTPAGRSLLEVISPAVSGWLGSIFG